MRRSTPLEAARILSLCLFAALAVAPCAAQSSGKASRTSRRAVLVRGSEAVKGLPNFGRNALPGLYGEYRLEPTAKGAEALPERILVWMTQEALYLSPADWRFSRVEGRAAWIAAERTGSANDAGRRLVLFDRPFGSEGQARTPALDGPRLPPQRRGGLRARVRPIRRALSRSPCFFPFQRAVRYGRIVSRDPGVVKSLPLRISPSVRSSPRRAPWRIRRAPRAP
jgi:hypothetical protein